MPPASLAWLFSLEQFGIKLGLESITTVLDALDRPDRSFASVHVGGTNGKGSVTAMVAAALGRAGIRTGRFTSPHLVHVRERFVVGGAPVAEVTLTAVLDDLKETVERLLASGALPALPTFFEVTTAAAFEIFRRAGVEVAVCEVGLGGRLDATNVLRPLVSAITSIGFDHERYLGNTLAAIAAEKAGIVKPATPVVVGRLPSEARDVVERAARAADARVIDAAADVSTRRLAASDIWAPPRIRMTTPVREYGELAIGLRGEHQIDNAAVAVRMLEVLDERGVHVPPEAIAGGLSSTSWPGRMDRRHLAGGREALLDAAHNPEGAAALAAFLRGLGAHRHPLVFAAMRDKDIGAMLARLLPACSLLVITRASTPRSEDPAKIASVAAELDPHVPVAVELDVGRAMETAWRSSRLIVIAGSIFLLGDVLTRLERS